VSLYDPLEVHQRIPINTGSGKITISERTVCNIHWLGEATSRWEKEQLSKFMPGINYCSVSVLSNAISSERTLFFLSIENGSR